MREYGPAGKDFGEDNEAAAPYVPLARTFLGQLKSRMAAGGLDQLSRTHRLPDGTVITVESRFGQDSFRIETVPVPNPGTVPPPEVPVPPPEEFPEVKIPEPPKPEIKPYMWIGARIMWEKYTESLWFGSGADPRVAWDGLGLVVMEPGNNGLVLTDWWLFWAIGRTANESQGHKTIDIAAMQADFTGFFPWVPEGMHNLKLYNSESGTRMMFTKHGLRLYDVFNTNSTTIDPTTQLTPHDPLHPDGEPRDVSNLSGGMSWIPMQAYVPWAQHHKWDQVVTLDPWEAERIEPYDKRHKVAYARDVLDASGVKINGASSVIPGEYVVKMFQLNDPGPFSTRRGQLTQFLPGAFRYTDAADADEFRTITNLPMKVEIEVRVNKGAGMKTQRFEIEPQDFTDDLLGRPVNPFGDRNPFASCNYYDGPNPHAKNWWQGAILVNPSQGTIRKVDNYPSRMCEPAPYDIDKLRRMRYPGDFYVDARNGASFAYSGYPATVPYAFGYWIHRILNMQCAGYFFPSGCPMREWSVEEIAAAAPAAGAVSIYQYDAVTNTFTDVEAEAYAGGGPPPGIGWWNYLKSKSLALCHQPMWCDLYGAHGLSITGENITYPEGQACCEDVYFGNG